MQIVMAAHSFPRAEGDVAGAFIWRLGEALVTRGHGVTVVAPADRGDVGEPMLGNVRVRRVPYPPPAQEPPGSSGPIPQRAAPPAGAPAFARLGRARARAVPGGARAPQAHAIPALGGGPAGLAMRIAERAARPFIVTL